MKKITDILPKGKPLCQIFQALTNHYSNFTYLRKDKPNKKAC